MMGFFRPSEPLSFFSGALSIQRIRSKTLRKRPASFPSYQNKELASRRSAGIGAPVSPTARFGSGLLGDASLSRLLKIYRIYIM